jgi:hypothetical protein
MPRWSKLGRCARAGQASLARCLLTPMESRASLAHWHLAADIDSLCHVCTQKFEHLFHVNEEHGSFYLQSKVRPCRSIRHPYVMFAMLGHMLLLLEASLNASLG